MLAARLLFVLLLQVAALAHAELRVFELRHVAPESLREPVQSLLAPYEKLSVVGNSLVVDAAPATLQRIEALLSTLDVVQRNLVIRLRRHDEGRAPSISRLLGDEREGREERLTTTQPAGRDSTVDVRASKTTSTGTRATEQSIRALDGSQVGIRDGQLVALGLGGLWGPQLAYTELSQALTVNVRLQGETVHLEVSAQNDRNDDGTIRTGGIDSTLNGPLGEWIWLGASGADGGAQQADTGTRIQTRARVEEQYEIRVELAP